MTRKELSIIREKYFLKQPYQFVFYDEYNYSILQNIMYTKKPGRNSFSLSDAIIMLDTETSKSIPDIVCENYVVAWTISIRTFHKNIVTLYGNKPSQCMECIQLLIDNIPGDKLYIYIFNASYDWTFLKRFFLNRFGYPIKQLNTKPHYPVYIEFNNGLVIRDALILAQRKLERWASDMNVEHQKAVGYWDYDKIRNQDYKFTKEELKYIENDTLAGVECIDALLQSINKELYSIPWTATGIPRDEVKKRGKMHNGNYNFKKQVVSFAMQKRLETIFHGGYTHGNRLYYNEVIGGKNSFIDDEISCYDFSSSYPFCLIAEKFPVEYFTPMTDRSIDEIVSDADNNAYIFNLIMVNVRLKDECYPMPYLQFSKCKKTINANVDNGRIISCDYCEIMINELDAEILYHTYDFEYHICVDVYASHKDYLPKWFTDYVYEQFELKTMLKGGDKVLYNVAKGRL